MPARMLLTTRAGAVSDVAHGSPVAERRLVTSDGMWPTALSPGGPIALVGLERGEGSPGAHVEVRQATGPPHTAGGSHRQVFIAPRLPIYPAWSPGGDYVSFVASDGERLGLYTWSPAEPGADVVRVETGMPIFHAWHPRTAVIAVHADSELRLTKADGSDRLLLARDAGGFRVPAWSADGRLLAWAVASGGPTRVRVYAGGETSDVGRFSGAVALAFRPGTTELSIAVAANPATGVFDSLFLTGSEAKASPAPRRLASGPFAACSWSPAGDRVALVVPTQGGDGRYQVQVRGVGGDVVAVSEAIFLSLDTRTAFGFFDQFALSHPWWDPGGDGIVLSGRLPGDGVSASFGDPDGPHALWWPGLAGRGFEVVGPAEFACFPTRSA